MTLVLPFATLPLFRHPFGAEPFLEAMAQGPAGASGPHAEAKARLLGLCGLALWLPAVAWFLR